MSTHPIARAADLRCAQVRGRTAPVLGLGQTRDSESGKSGAIRTSFRLIANHCSATATRSHMILNSAQEYADSYTHYV